MESRPLLPLAVVGGGKFCLYCKGIYGGRPRGLGTSLGKTVRLSRLFAIFALFCLLLWPQVTGSHAQAQSSSQASSGVVIEDIRYGINAGKTRVVVDLNRKSDFRVFVLADPPRLVIDLPKAGWKVPRSRPVTTGQILKSYRSGDLDEGVTRIVFDMRRAATVDGAFALPPGGTSGDRVVVDIAPASENLFRAALDRVHGNKLLGGAAIGTAPAQPAAVPDAGMASARNDAAARAVPPASAETADADKPVRKPQTGGAAPSGGKTLRKYVIVIDAGHGGTDPGAVSSAGVYEKNITLAIARELRRQLEDTGRYRVVMTRDRDVQIRLRDRLDMARKERADLFISIHADKIQRSNVRGASIYTLSRTASDAETARLAERENAAGVVAGVDLSSESQEVAGILLDLAMREKMNESSLLARFLEDAFRSKNVKLLPNSHRSAGFAVLKAPDVPSVLIESGFMSNPAEVKLLSSAEFQRRISSAILQGIDDYFRKIRALQKI